MVRNYVIILLACLPIFTGASKAEQTGRHHGFTLGSSFDVAEKNAEIHGWTLAPLSEHLPGQWQVEGTELSLFVCMDKVASILEQLPGGFEEFVTLVWQIQGTLGQPNIQIAAFDAGAAHISTIDARFIEKDGGTTVQLQSIDDHLNLTLNRYSSVDCGE